jgi:hypothetical protein
MMNIMDIVVFSLMDGSCQVCAGLTRWSQSHAQPGTCRPLSLVDAGLDWSGNMSLTWFMSTMCLVSCRYRM